MVLSSHDGGWCWQLHMAANMALVRHPRRNADPAPQPSHGYYYFSFDVSLFSIPVGLSSLAQRIAPIDDRSQLSSLDEVSEEEKVLSTGGL